MSNSLLEHLSAINDLVEDVVRENAELKRKLAAQNDNRKKLSPGEVNTMRLMKRAGFTQAEIAESFDVNPATVSRIVRGIYHR
ncbi:helix-turn-helix DNA binding domain protein [Mycobacterium phage Kalnoky]|uniref:HTH DNA binding protein n=1 Tax=Mycobacterium phage PurpleHaze TaxID=1983577 RepID=A0A220NRV7_9CAUD|nr:HTH DNA binding protein [Mycobacterium phage Jobu08]YP_010060008.1 HTH DNA binding protein [Mycobacterium phage Purple Haze]AXC35156.1 helix-turn-helix DNA binding domain protein [Mycobacterium phage Phranny]AXH44097.1 helix-turn-helix DNA binding domain protein [Mycobacterium phage Kalnoky]AXH44505.1 helix-turn-helix DNA binding domain protein [Mycobacterium phage Marius]AXH44676.1 helix-turn-helix DNA binding domain protein [Mycobacterium phage PhishRPhriends]AXH44826.1 helix-turn-helix 